MYAGCAGPAGLAGMVNLFGGQLWDSKTHSGTAGIITSKNAPDEIQVVNCQELYARAGSEICMRTVEFVPCDGTSATQGLSLATSLNGKRALFGPPMVSTG